jgi:hypothetical protein
VHVICYDLYFVCFIDCSVLAAAAATAVRFWTSAGTPVVQACSSTTFPLTMADSLDINKKVSAGEGVHDMSESLLALDHNLLFMLTSVKLAFNRL